LAAARAAPCGAGSLGATIQGYGPGVIELDADLRLLARLAAPAGKPAGDAPFKPSSAQSYVDGVRARLAGDSLLAAQQLSHALWGHADACRAAGEYVAVLGTLKRHPDAPAFNSLRAENQGCVNLPNR